MPTRRRDRHLRGLRGPLAQPNALTPRTANPARRLSRAEYFDETVHTAVDRVGRHCPEALTGVTFGIEDVPLLKTAWSGDQVPLAAAVEGDQELLSQVVLYRRPLEHRAASRRGLRILVHRTVVEQLAALTGRSVDELDPEGISEQD